MRFTINSVILWPKKEGFDPKVLSFKMQSVNIITGASCTGKSALIPIIDYCLGSEKCTIPVDVIRNACSWFGVLFDLDNGQLLLCRREPGEQASTKDMFVLRDKEITIPKTLSKNANLESIKDILNEYFGMSFLELDSTAGVFRASYRDFMAFLFQPQNILANENVLFYKADTMEHRKKLIDVFPYALGAVTSETLAKRMEIERLKKASERYKHDIDQIRTAVDRWRQEVAGWLMQAHEYGLTTFQANNTNDFEGQVEELRAIAKKRVTDSRVFSYQVEVNSKEIAALQDEEQKLSQELFIARNRHKEMIRLTESIAEYDKSLQIQLNRLDISTWLQTRSMTEKPVVPLFQPSRENVAEELKLLCNAIRQIEQTTIGMANFPAAIQLELHNVKELIQDKSEKLEAIHKRIHIEQNPTVPSDEKYTLESISRFLGRVETAIATYERVGNDSELEKKLEETNARIAQLTKDINQPEIEGKLEFALSYLSAEMGKILAQLEVEHPEDPVELDINNLTVRVKNSSGRVDYLWEIGSASNWLSYHISLILALQHFFQTKSSVNVPNFLIFDQPSQVYFPSLHYLPTEDQQTVNNNDKAAVRKIFEALDDKVAVRKIFETLSAFIKNAGFGIQIIVTEHADDDVWGNITDINLVARWRGTEKLVPSEWIK